jgi:molybdate transport system substrate-binding protein
MLLLLAATLAVAMARLAVAEQGASPASTEISVFAAASLTSAFTEIARAFEAQQPGRKVSLNFGGSQQLAAQILEAAPADVFASANAEQMKRIVDAGLLRGTPKPFATNRLAIAVAPQNPEKISGLADLSRAGLVVVLAAEEVPAGRYAREALRKAGVTLTPASLETDVRSVLSKVALGEADAGIVYESDIAAAASSVTKVEIPAEHNVVASYPIAALSRGAHSDAAAALLDFVCSDAGRAILSRFGFGVP